MYNNSFGGLPNILFIMHKPESLGM